MAYTPRELRFKENKSLKTFLQRPRTNETLDDYVKDILALDYFKNYLRIEDSTMGSRRGLIDLTREISTTLLLADESWQTKVGDNLTRIYQALHNASTRNGPYETLRAFGMANLRCYHMLTTITT